MRKLLTVMTDLLFPPSPQLLLIRQNETTGKNLYFVRLVNNIFCLSQYSEPLIRAAITENKFHNNSKATQILSSLLEIWIRKQTCELIFIPIPLGPKRYRKRGYNQVENILKKVNVPIAIRTDILSRPIDTKPQSELHKSERQKNIKGAFVCDSEKMRGLKNVKIVLVDDVVTTGATMAAARAKLAPHLHPTSTLTCLAIAH